MARILISHATRAGATSDVADILAAGLRELDHDVVVSRCQIAPSPDDFDLVVVGSGIHAGSWYGEAVNWLTRHSASLTGRVALFNVCLNAADPAKQDEALGYNAGLAADLDASSSASFAGRFVPERVGFLKRWLLRSMNQKPADHVDPGAIRAWATTLAALPS